MEQPRKRARKSDLPPSKLPVQVIKGVPESDATGVPPPEILHLAIDAAPNGMVLVNSAGKIVLINTETERIFGYSREELLGKSAEILLPGHQAGFEISPGASKESEPMGAGRELIGRRKDGSEFPVEIGLTVLHTARGRKVLSSVVDITQRKRLADLERQHKDVERAAAESRAQSRLLATMSHEIRTPLTGILGCVDLLVNSVNRGSSDGTPTPAAGADLPQKDIMSIMRHCGDALMQVTNDFLEYSRLAAGSVVLAERAVLRIRSLIDEVISMVAPLTRAKGIHMEAQVAPDVPADLIGDPGRCRQVLLNLVSNAVKFTNAGGVFVTATWAPELCRLFVAVRDTGLGISPEGQARLFQPFVQADASTAREFGGTGLGLVISRRLVELMGGTLAFTSEQSKGSCFSFNMCVDLPPPSALPAIMIGAGTETALVSRDPSAPPADGGAAPVTSRSGHILLADDDPVNLKVVVALLARLGHSARTAVNGEEAVRMATSEPFDLVLMDCEMPVMDGLAASAELRRRGLALPIVALSANVMPEDRERCLAAGMNEHLPKPASLANLRQCLNRWIL